MQEFVDMIDPLIHDRRNISQEILDGSMSRDKTRKRLQMLQQLFSHIERGYEKYCSENGFTKIRVPNIVSTIGACENWRTLFKVNHPSSFFHLLTQTGQLFLEAALVDDDRVWCLTKSFRKEDIEDDRHLCEFHLLEIEGAFAFPELLKHMSSLLRSILIEVIDSSSNELRIGLGIDLAYLEEYATNDPLVVSYSQCIDALGKIGPGLKWGSDLKAEHEEILLEHFTGGRLPIFVTHFPEEIKFFNMALNQDDMKTVLSVDLLLPHSGEAMGGAQRESEFSTLVHRLKTSEMFNHHLKMGGRYEDFKPYMDLIENKITPLHSGCGVGIERVIQSLIKCRDIRLCSVDYLSKMFFAWDALVTVEANN